MHTPPTSERTSGSDFDEPPYFDRGGGNAFSRHGNESAPRDIPVRNKEGSASPARRSTVKENLCERYGEKSLKAERPAAARVLSSEEETVVEKMWQPLFDSEGKPTVRINQFLRGVALHMVRVETYGRGHSNTMQLENYEPKDSIVVGPRKMRKFYEQMKASQESYPWDGTYKSLETKFKV
jgi:hypothetical protein